MWIFRGFWFEPTARWQQRKFKGLLFVAYVRAIITCSESLDFYSFYILLLQPGLHQAYVDAVYLEGVWGTLAFREPNTLIPIWLAWSQLQSH